MEQYPIMRRTLESVASERLNKLGKNPSIISTRQDLTIDQEALKDIVRKATPCPSRSSSQQDLSKSKKLSNDSNSNNNNHNNNNGTNNSSGEETTGSLLNYSDKFKKKFLKPNLQINLPNLLKKSPSTPNRLFRGVNQTNNNSPPQSKIQQEQQQSSTLQQDPSV
jgi:hypothetical protein